MIKNLTKKWLDNKNACYDGVRWFDRQELTNTIKILYQLIKEDESDWADWLILHLVNKKQLLEILLGLLGLIKPGIKTKETICFIEETNSIIKSYLKRPNRKVINKADSLWDKLDNYLEDVLNKTEEFCVEILLNTMSTITDDMVEHPDIIGNVYYFLVNVENPRISHRSFYKKFMEIVENVLGDKNGK